MTGIKGYPDQKKAGDGAAQFATINPVREQQQALDVLAHIFHQSIANDAAETGSTARIIKATAHAVLVGDLISFKTGSLDTREYRVAAIPDVDHFTLAEEAAAAPANGDQFEVLRPKAPAVDEDGALAVGATFSLPYSGTPGVAAPAEAAFVGGVDTNGDMQGVAVDTDGQLQVDVLSSALPSGAATAAKQDTGNTSLDSIDTKLTSQATAANQTTEIAAIGTMSAKLPSALGQTTMADSMSVAIASDQSAVPVANFPTTVDTDSGAAGASTPRAVLATRHEAVATPLAATLSSGSAAVDYNAGAASANTLRTAVAATNIGYTAKGKISGASLTGSYATLLNPTSDLRILAILNSCDNTIMVSLDGGSTDSFELEAGESVILDLAANGLKFDNAVNVSAKHAGAAPTAGSVRASGVG